MLLVLIILCVGLLGFIIYSAVSPKSSRTLRLASLAALGLITIALGICGVILIRGPKQVQTPIPLPFLPDDAPPAKKTNIMPVIVFIATFLFLVGLIIVTTLKEKKKPSVPTKETASPAIFQDTAELSGNMESEHIDLEEDSFDVGID